VHLVRHLSGRDRRRDEHRTANRASLRDGTRDRSARAQPHNDDRIAESTGDFDR
jgi:hypothetical protein